MIKEIFVLSLMLVIPLSANAQIVNDGTDHVDVYDYPFDITVLEGGSFTLHNENRTGSIDIVSHGWFDKHIALENSTVTVQLTDAMFPDIYYVTDIMDNNFYSTITVKEIHVPQFNVTSSETSGEFILIDEEPVTEGTHETAIIEIPAGGSPQQIAESEQDSYFTSTSNTEVLDLRLRILQVLESIFKIILG